jgi:hypothetical protein
MKQTYLSIVLLSVLLFIGFFISNLVVSAQQSSSLILTNLSLAESTAISDNLVRTASTPTPTSTPPSYTLIFSAEPGPDVDTLQNIAMGATTDDEILDKVVDYYHQNRDRLRVLWREDNDTRLAALFSMYLVHISTAYGEAVYPSSLIEYIGQARAQCGTYTYAESRIATVLGLTWRAVEFVGEHAWMEVLISGQWETFDATTNTWLSKGVDELMRGEPRTYRQFYTPMLDVNRPDARLHLAEGYNMPRLRLRMPTVGIVYMPPGELRIGYPAAS